MNKSALLLLALAALGGCSLTPAYQRPDLPVAAQWQEGADGRRQAAATDWRAFFPDPRLQGLIAAALEHNRDLRIAVGRVEEARAQYGILRADRLPSLNLTAGRSASRTPGDLSLSGSPLSVQRYDVGLALLPFELDFWGRVKNLSDAGLASYLATESAQRAVRLSLIADVANAYFSLLEMEERSQLAQTTLKTREETRALLEKRREVGLTRDLDILQAEGALQTARADLASLELQRSTAAHALTLLVGRDAVDLPPAKSLTEQGVVPDLAAGLPADVLLARPDVIAAEQRLIAANANIGAARAAFLPKVLLTATLGTASRELAGLFEAGSGAWSFQPTLSLPLFDAGRSAANVDLAEARKVIAVADYEKTVQQAFREVADQLAARDKLAEQRRAVEAGAQAQTERLRIAQALYDAGLTSHLDVLDAQREAYAARQTAIQVRRAQLGAAAQLYKALGGGG